MDDGGDEGERSRLSKPGDNVYALLGMIFAWFDGCVKDCYNEKEGERQDKRVFEVLSFGGVDAVAED